MPGEHYRFPLCKNARSGARTTYEMRAFGRKCVRERAAKGEDMRRVRINMAVPRLSFHFIYARKFGLRRWLLDGR